jgi:hypothetical protein
MSKKKFIQVVHNLGITILGIISILLPLIYIKYIAWIPLVIVFSWIIFNGCIVDYLHHNNPNIDTKLTDNITPAFKFFIKRLPDYIKNYYLNNPNRHIFIIYFVQLLIITIICYRVIYNIDILK